MLFLVISDDGIYARPLTASNLADAASQIKQLYGLGNATINVAAIIPELTGTLVQDPVDPAQATITQTGDSGTQATLISQANTALTNNATYLALQSPTTAQALAQVRALTQQVDGLIRLAVGNFSGTS